MLEQIRNFPWKDLRWSILVSVAILGSLLAQATPTRKAILLSQSQVAWRQVGVSTEDALEKAVPFRELTFLKGDPVPAVVSGINTVITQSQCSDHPSELGVYECSGTLVTKL